MSGHLVSFIVPVWQNGYNEMQLGDPVDPVSDYIPPTEVSGADAALAKRPRTSAAPVIRSAMSRYIVRYRDGL
jgi:hypothetical protein